MIYIGLRFDTAKKIEFLGNSDDIADQITGRNEDCSIESTVHRIIVTGFYLGEG